MEYGIWETKKTARSRFCKTNVFNRGHYSLFKAFKVNKKSYL